MLSYKQFSLLLMAIVVITYGLIIIFNVWDPVPTGNRMLFYYQMAKLESESNKDTINIIVGDSSAGNAIDAQYMGELSGQKTLNLGLTGSFGLIGSANIMEQAWHLLPHLKNVIIIQTPDIWRRPIETEAYFSTKYWFNPLDFQGFYTVNEAIRKYMEWRLRPAHFYVAALSIFGYGPKDSDGVDHLYDYLVQGDVIYGNGTKKTTGDEKLQDVIHKDKIFEVSYMDMMCAKYHLNCIFVHGPLMQEIYMKSPEKYKEFNALLKEKAGHIHIIEKPFYFPTRKMGDSLDHVGVAYKKEVTKEYFLSLKSALKFKQDE
jgi:hypothetical protein